MKTLFVFQKLISRSLNKKTVRWQVFWLIQILKPSRFIPLFFIQEDYIHIRWTPTFAKATVGNSGRGLQNHKKDLQLRAQLRNFQYIEAPDSHIKVFPKRKNPPNRYKYTIYS